MGRKKEVETASRPVVLAKLGLLTALVAAGFMISSYIKPPQPAQKNTSQFEIEAIDPEGVVAGIADELNVEPITTKTETVKNQIAAEAAALIENTASQASDIVYDHTLKPIVDQIDKLPEPQQDRLREQLCTQ